MWNRLTTLWQRLAGSLWFIPLLIVIGAVALAVALIEAQQFVDREALAGFPRIFGADAESTRSMLAAIAGSMITVAGVTFSITVVAVSQASSQYTPRILRNFMRDRTSQVVLGVFVGIFVYCLVVVRTIRADEAVRFIPSLAALGAYLLAIAGIGFLVYFIHHIAGTLEAGTILARIGQETTEAVERLFPHMNGRDSPPGQSSLPERWYPIAASATGYIQRIDGDGLLRAAADRDTVLRMEHGVGDFVYAGMPLLSAAAPEAVEDRLDRYFVVDSYRTVHQDAEFGIRQMVDIALKALSPGINDSTTAVTCVDHIGAVLVRLAGRRVEAPNRFEAGRLRLIACGPTFESLAGVAFDEIRRNAGTNVSVLSRMLRVIGLVGTEISDPDRRAVLRRHAQRLLRTAEQNMPMEEDLAEVRQHFEWVIGRLASQHPAAPRV